MVYSYDRRAASGGSLLEAKLVWAKQLADAMAARFSGAGGWRAHHIHSKVSSHGRGVDYEGESEVMGFTMHASITVEGHPQMHLHFVAKGSLMDPTNIDLVEMHKHLEDSTTTIKVDESAPMEKVVMDASLFFSKFVNKIPV